MPDLPGLRRVEPDLMHLTLAFLGATPDDRLPAVTAAVRAAAGRAAFRIELDHTDRFPRSGPPRVVWLGMSAGADESSALAADVRSALSARSLPFDDKPFRPHVTLGRIRETATREEARAIAAAIAALRMPPLRFVADAVHVVESHVSSKGPRYDSRADVRLASADPRAISRVPRA